MRVIQPHCKQSRDWEAEKAIAEFQIADLSNDDRIRRTAGTPSDRLRDGPSCDNVLMKDCLKMQ